MKEEWIDIEGYEGIYKVSTYGRIMSSYTRDRSNETFKTILKPQSNGHYNHVRLSKEGKGKTHNVSALVIKAFIPNVENKSTINHKDGVKTNDRVDNLEWATRSENIQHAYDNGLIKRQVGNQYTRKKDMVKKFVSVLQKIGTHRPCSNCQKYIINAGIEIYPYYG